MGPEGAAGSRKERNSDVEIQHCGSIEMLGSLVALCYYRPALKQENGRGRRLALAIIALRSLPLHPEDRLEGESLDFQRKARDSRRSVVIDSCLLDKLVLARGQVLISIAYYQM